MKRRKRFVILIIAALVFTAVGIAGFLILRKPKDKLAGIKQRGNNYLMSEEYDKAVEEFLAAIELAPEDTVNYIQLSEAYIGMNDYNNASVYLEDAAELTRDSSDPQSIDQYISICIKLADCYRLAGKENERVRVLKEANEITRSGRIADLLKEYYPEPPRSDILEGEYSVENGLMVSLSGDGDIYYTLDGTDPTLESFLYRSSIMLPIGNHVLNAAVCNEYGFFSEVNSFTFFVKEPDYVVRAKNYTRDKDYEAAIDNYIKALMSDSGNAEAYFGLTQVYITTQDYESAVETVLSGLSVIPEDARLLELAARLKPQVEASLASGTYISDDPISVSLSGGSRIFYTVDGSDPTEHGTEYSKPIILEKGLNEIKAVSQSEYGTYGDNAAFDYTIHYNDTDGSNTPEQDKSTPDNGSGNDKNTNGSTGNDKSTGGSAGSDNNTGGSAGSDKNTGGSSGSSSNTGGSAGSDNNTGGSAGSDKNTGGSSGSGSNSGGSAGSGDNGINDSGSGNTPGLDEQGSIIWDDSRVEAEIRKQLGIKDGPITAASAEEFTGTIDLSGINVSAFSDLKWFKNMSVLICRGNDLKDADFINSLKVDRVIAAYAGMDEVKAITNTKVLKSIRHLGIRVASFSIGDMSMLELLGFFSYMNQVMGELDNLEYLDLSDNGLTDISLLSQFNNIDKVKYLILRDNEIEDLSVLADFNNLVYLDITNNNVSDFSPVEHVTTIIGRE